MLRNRIYYHIKPLVPASIRMSIRRWYASRKRNQVDDVWPILPGSEQPPANWPGWPEGKKFALVLTHDVESQVGLDKCRRLMKLEQELGFRSLFNFIPEGSYSVPSQLRNELRQNGFEVGVHDLHHDGKLYLSRKKFRRHAVRINHYLKDWGATGFRSGFMLHNLDWLLDLHIQYDCSTFDTDPFEPQPKGRNTIFPFWVPRPNSELQTPNSEISNSHLQTSRSGYVELPYTLPQDSTLFLLLLERHPDIWFQKLNWIANHGGMVMVNVHPDYLALDNQMTRSTFPVTRYLDLLRYISNRYHGQFWHTTPAEVAGWYKETVVRKQSSSMKPALPKEGRFAGKRAAVVLYSYYASDPRPRRETESLAAEGMEIDVICLRKDSSVALYEKKDGVNIFRVPLKRRRSGKLTYVFQYACFLFASFVILSLKTLKRRYKLVHTHNMPDFLVFSAIVPRLLGAKVILDLHDPMPELFSSIYYLKDKDLLVRCLRKTEKLSIAFADVVLTPNKAFKDLFASRSCAPEKIQIIMNSPQAEIFNSDRSVQLSDSPSQKKGFTVMYHGLLVERHGLDLAIRAIARLRSRIPDLRLQLYGEPTPYMNEIMRLVRELKLGDIVCYHGFKPLEDISRAISTIDLGLIPNRLNPFTRINMPTRIFEYLAMAKPVIAPRTKGITDYFDDTQIVFFSTDSVEDLAARIEWAYMNPVEVAGILKRGCEVYEKHRWEIEEMKLLKVVGTLLQVNPSEAPPASAGENSTAELLI